MRKKNRKDPFYDLIQQLKAYQAQNVIKKPKTSSKKKPRKTK